MITLNALGILKADREPSPNPAIRTGTSPGITRPRPHKKRANLACYGTREQRSRRRARSESAR
jgi:hypothetical protein